MDISILTVHAAAMYWAYLFSQLGKIIFPVRKKDFPRHKKSLRLEAIGDNGHPAGLITIFLLALAKVRRKSETAKKKSEKFSFLAHFFYLYTIFLYYFHHFFLLDDSDISSFLIEFFYLFHLGRACSLTFNYDISLSRNR